MKRETNNSYLTLTEVAEVMKITRRTVYNYIKAGILKYSRVGRQYRIKSQDLETFIKPTPGKPAGKRKRAV